MDPSLEYGHAISLKEMNETIRSTYRLPRRVGQFASCAPKNRCIGQTNRRLRDFFDRNMDIFQNQVTLVLVRKPGYRLLGFKPLELIYLIVGPKR